MNILFEKANPQHKEIIFEWLNKPHVMEYWDNSDAHRNDICIFLEGRKIHSKYFDGAFSYWIGLINEEPYCLIMTSEIIKDKALPKLWNDNLSKTGKTISIDFCIGHEKFLGSGHAAPTLEAFTKFYNSQISPTADTFFIDPDENNFKAKHVYEKSGFKFIDNFVMQNGYFEGHESCLMVKKL